MTGESAADPGKGAASARKLAAARLETLTAWLDGAGRIEDAQIEEFLGRVRSEPDAKVAASAIAALIASPRLALAQLEHIARSDRALMLRHQPLIQRTYLARRLETEVSDELLERVLELADASIQTRLVRDARLTRKQAERLAQRGANPTLRANAQAWLQDKKAWK
jgi:hypothetical protein